MLEPNIDNNRRTTVEQRTSEANKSKKKQPQRSRTTSKESNIKLLPTRWENDAQNAELKDAERS